MRRQKCFTHDSIEFMSRILANSGTSQSTAWPPSILKCLQDGSPPSDRYEHTHIYNVYMYIYTVCNIYTMYARYTAATQCTSETQCTVTHIDRLFTICTPCMYMHESQQQRSVQVIPSAL
jgi:hypothetical protein